MQHLSKKERYEVISKATYRRRLRKLTTIYPWLAKWQNKITPGLRHILLVKAFLDEVLSRMSVHHIARPTSDEIRTIALSIYGHLLSGASWGHTFSETLADVVLDRLSEQNPRTIRKTLQNALGSATRAGRDSLLPENLNTHTTTATRRFGFCTAQGE